MSNTELKNTFYHVTKTEEDFDKCINILENIFINARKIKSVKEFKIQVDDVFDSTGSSMYYISVAWIDKFNRLQLINSKYKCK